MQRHALASLFALLQSLLLGLYDGRLDRRGDMHAETCACITFMVLRSVGMYVCMVVGLAAGRDTQAETCTCITLVALS